MSDSRSSTGSAEVRDMLGSIPELWGKAGPVNLPDAAFNAIAAKFTKALEDARGNAQAQRITGACNELEEAACLIWAELCPGMVMGDSDLPHYEAAAKAVLALRSPAYAGLDPDTVQACYAAVLEERCQRGTPWDLACTTIARKLLGMIGEAHRAPADSPSVSSTPREAGQ